MLVGKNNSIFPAGRELFRPQFCFKTWKYGDKAVLFCKLLLSASSVRCFPKVISAGIKLVRYHLNWRKDSLLTKRFLF